MFHLRSIIILFLLSTSTLFAQSANEFLNPEFWKSNPSVALVDQKIAEGNSISELTRNAFDPVCYAILEGSDVATIQHLLSKLGNDVNKITHDSRTYLFWAAYKSNLELMQVLLDLGAKTNLRDSHGNTIMNFAASSGVTNTAVFDFCIQFGANPSEEKNRDGANTLLLVAPYLKDTELIDYFVKKGVKATATDDFGNGIFNYAAKGGNIKLLEALIAKGLPFKTSTKNGDNAITFASMGTRNHKNSLAVYQFLEKKWLVVNATDHSGQNALHRIANTSADLEIFNYFIDHKVDVNQKDDEGNTPFMNAANRNDLKVVQFLKPHVTDINLKNNEGQTALTKAVDRNSPEVVEYLLKNGADVTVIDTEGNTLAYYLLHNFRPKASEGFETKLKLLQQHGFELNQLQNHNNSLLHLAAQDNNLALLKRLEAFNMDINAKNSDGLTVLQISAMKAKNLEILKYVLSQGADKTVVTEFDESVYDLASENELLQQPNSDINFLK